MALTPVEELRLQKVEEIAAKLGHLIQGIGSKNQLNRLLTLCNDENRKIGLRIDTLETDVSELLDLVRKLQ